MVERLAVALDVPLADRNAVLLAAGFAPAYGERELGAPELARVRRALEFILRQQEPYPAIVVDGRWDVVMRNDAARRIFDLFLDSPPLGRAEARNALRATFHPDGLRRFIVNWEELAGPLVSALHRDAATSPAAAALRDELLAYPGVPARWRTPDPGATAPPLLAMRLQRGDLRLAFFSTFTVLAAPQDVTLQQLRIECFPRGRGSSIVRGAARRADVGANGVAATSLAPRVGRRFGRVADSTAGPGPRRRRAVVGGGPGGSTAATFLAPRAASVALVGERFRASRVAIADPESAGDLRAHGVLDTVLAHGFQTKYGATFHDQSWRVGDARIPARSRGRPTIRRAPREFDQIPPSTRRSPGHGVPARVGQDVSFDRDGVTARIGPGPVSRRSSR
jgi:hypothetical protein